VLAVPMAATALPTRGATSGGGDDALVPKGDAARRGESGLSAFTVAREPTVAASAFTVAREPTVGLKERPLS